MLIEYAALGALLVALLFATLVGMRRRRAQASAGDSALTFPYTDGGSADAERTDQTGFDPAFDGGTPSHEDGFEGNGGPDAGGFDGSGAPDASGWGDGGGGHHD